MTEVTALFFEGELRALLQPGHFGIPLHFFRTIDSTNDFAKKIAGRGGPEGTLVVSEEQTAGRGRMGRSWISPPGTGIWMSLLLRPPFLPSQAPLITSLAAVAVAGSIRRVTGLPAGIKWPNDIIINDKKVGGILIELSAGERFVKYLIVGIGINVNTEDFPEEIREHATSLRISSGRKISRMEILISVLRELERLYSAALLSFDFKPILETYRSWSATIGRRITATRSGREFSALALDITPNGGLLIEKDTGGIEEIISGEVQLIRPAESVSELQ
ncbi:MAG: biotin--[acetyl-CoA-carboxylase] ligase [Candidatus Euphemobacter frigidus]|nr:biotin--[acetyl-CoA-carboxylase] ligase [Candidatus Euphemobacter frigidus]MDP8276023.1 biotin--[acetyl-CoA-carboxylase] ligase [Candidatus Euphemobacter frigidus]